MNIKNHNKVLYGLLGLMILTTCAFAFTAFNAPTLDNSNSIVGYEGRVCTSTTGDFEGRETPAGVGINEEIGCNHNLLVSAGANAIRDILGQQTSFGNFTAIALCNATAGCTGTDAADTTLDAEYTDSGLARAYGAYGELGGVGNWSVAHTFTATADSLETNQTGLFNQTTVADSTMLAENTFTLVTLQTNDQLTINWTITAKDGA